MPYHRETTKLKHYDEAKKMAHNPQIVKTKENIKLSHSVPRQRQPSGNNQRMKTLRQGHQ